MRRPSLFAPGTAGRTTNTSSSRWGDHAPSIAVMPPSLPLRPITTHINLLVVGASRSGKGAFIQTFEEVLGLTPAPKSPVAAAAPISCPPDPNGPPVPGHDVDTSSAGQGAGDASDPWSAFSAKPSDWRTTYQPLLVPGAGRELVFSVQSAPGWGATLDPAAWLETLVGLVLAARQDDWGELGGARGLHKSLVCGALAHSYTAALYFLPPTGPTATDLVLMAALSQALPLVPVVGACWTAPGGQGEAAAVAQMMAEVEQLLAAPGEVVPGLQPGDIQLPTRPAIKPLWLSPVSAAARRSSEAPAAGGSAAGGGDTATPASPKTATRLAQGSLDVVSLCSEDEVFCTPQPASAAAAAAPAAAPAAPAAGAGAADKEPDAGGSSQGGAVAVEGLQQLVELLAGQEVYCLLDASWDAYTSFCTAYDIAAGQLAPLVNSHLERFNPQLLAGPGGAKAAQKAQEEHDKVVKELLGNLGTNIHHNPWGQTIAYQAQNSGWSPAVQELCKRLVALP